MRPIQDLPHDTMSKVAAAISRGLRPYERGFIDGLLAPLGTSFDDLIPPTQFVIKADLT